MKTGKARRTAGPPRIKPASAPRPRRSAGKESDGGHFPVVGIGASAGGLDAFLQLFHGLPAVTGMAFIVVQHMDPSKESLLADILARSIRIPIVVGKDGMRIQPERIHVIPPNTNMGVANGLISLFPRPLTQGPHLPVDFFFRSLAQGLKGRAIGVVLSGNGSDGTQGVRAIKAEGGITFAQDEQSAKYTGMPASAAASGFVDFVLPPERIAAELARIASHPYVARIAEGLVHDPALESEEDIGRIFQHRPGRDRRGLRPVQAVHHDAQDPAAHGPPQDRRPEVVRRPYPGTSRRAGRPVPGLPDQRHLVLQGPRGVRGAPNEGVPPPAGEPGAVGRRPGVGPGVFHGGGGVFHRPLPAGDDGEQGSDVPSPDLRDGHPRDGAGGGPGRDLPGGDLAGRLPGEAAPLLRQNGTRLPDRQADPGVVHLRPPEPGERPALLPAGPDQLPERADLHEAAPPEKDPVGIPLCSEAREIPCSGNLRDRGRDDGPVRGRGPEVPDLRQERGPRPPARGLRSPLVRPGRFPGPAAGGRDRPEPGGDREGGGRHRPCPVRSPGRDRERAARHRPVPGEYGVLPRARARDGFLELREDGAGRPAAGRPNGDPAGPDEKQPGEEGRRRGRRERKPEGDRPPGRPDQGSRP